MAKLIGYLRYGHHAGQISCELANGEGNINTSLDADGNATVYVIGNIKLKIQK